jgi:hypothetical protein
LDQGHHFVGADQLTPPSHWLSTNGSLGLRLPIWFFGTSLLVHLNLPLVYFGPFFGHTPPFSSSSLKEARIFAANLLLLCFGDNKSPLPSLKETRISGRHCAAAGELAERTKMFWSISLSYALFRSLCALSLFSEVLPWTMLQDDRAHATLGSLPPESHTDRTSWNTLGHLFVGRLSDSLSLSRRSFAPPCTSPLFPVSGPENAAAMADHDESRRARAPPTLGFRRTRACIAELSSPGQRCRTIVSGTVLGHRDAAGRSVRAALRPPSPSSPFLGCREQFRRDLGCRDSSMSRPA